MCRWKQSWGRQPIDAVRRGNNACGEAYGEPATVLSIVGKLTPLFLRTTVAGRCYYSRHFTAEKMEAGRDEGIRSRSRRPYMAETDRCTQSGYPGAHPAPAFLLENSRPENQPLIGRPVPRHCLPSWTPTIQDKEAGFKGNELFPWLVRLNKTCLTSKKVGSSPHETLARRPHAIPINNKVGFRRERKRNHRITVTRLSS